MVRQKMICIYCDCKYTETFSLHQLFFNRKETACIQCLAKFEKIVGSVCERCGSVTEQKMICAQCKDPEKRNLTQSLTSNRSIFYYNPEMKIWMNRYKFYGDVTLATMFITDLQEYYEKYFKRFKIIVPIPLSEERLQERGFNQVEVLAELAGFTLTKCLKRVHTERQSKLNRTERLNREQIFSFSGGEKIQNVPILILDDVYTTGKTVGDAAIVLLQSGASEVFSLTLIRA